MILKESVSCLTFSKYYEKIRAWYGARQTTKKEVVMGDSKSTTKDVSGFTDAFLGTKTYETTISDGRDNVSARGNTSEESQERASDKWHDR